jgi:hypothetical protein
MNLRIYLPILFLTTFPVSDARDLLPAHWMEDISAIDGTTQKCIVFKSIPGVSYRVEVSDDLEHWVELSNFYGMGHEIVTPMLEVAPAPPGSPGPSGPGGTPATRRIVGLCLQRPSSGQGTVVSWPSLSDGQPVSALVDGELDTGWPASTRIMAEDDGYIFMALHLGASTPPPPAPNLSASDAAMLDIVEENLGTMNLLASNPNPPDRNIPDPAQQTEDSQRFWRIHANWGVDSDGDGSPDWAEFEIAANSQHPSQLIANAFNADTNGDGNPDQLDSDNDGVTDPDDADLDNPIVDWQATGEPRFAIFPFQAPADPWGYPQLPIQVTDHGEIVFGYGIWSKGAYLAVTRNASGAENCKIDGMNDVLGGQLIGTGNCDRDGDGYAETVCNVMWGAEDPIPIKNGEIYATPRFPGVPNAGRFVGRDGGFIANADGAPARWILPWSGGSQPYYGAVPAWAHSNRNADLIWGGDQALLSGVETEMPGSYSNLVPTPSGSVIACGGLGTNPALFNDGYWSIEPSLGPLTHFSTSGFGATASPLTIWCNGRTTSFAAAASGIPSDWKNRSRILNMSDSGNLLLCRDASNEIGFDALALGVPFALEDDIEATGVDNVSITSTQPGAGIDNKLWIMAPGSGQNLVRFITNAAANTCPLQLTSSANLAPGILESNDQIVAVGGGAGVNSQDLHLGIANGSVQSLSLPIGIKVMKERVIRVAVYLVEKDLGGGAVNAPDLAPDEGDLESYLNDIFSRQINTSIQVEYATITTNWDEDNDREFDIGDVDQHSSEQNHVLSLVPNPSPPSDIQVFILGLNIPMLGDAAGITNRAEKTCWIMGDAYNKHNSELAIKNTIAHEVGHIFVGYGHPDKETGPAPLPGTDHNCRLMRSGPGSDPSKKRLLTKQEWDAAENWLNSNAPQ